MSASLTAQKLHDEYLRSKRLQALAEEKLREVREEVQFPQLRDITNKAHLEHTLQLPNLALILPRVIDGNKEDARNLEAEFRRVADLERKELYYKARDIRDERIAEGSRTLPVEVAETLPVVRECDKWLDLSLYDYETPSQILAKLNAFQAWLDAQKISGGFQRSPRGSTPRQQQATGRPHRERTSCR
jgi:hypothetical protein